MTTPAPRLTILETQKKSGLHYVATGEGWELPVIDILHPAFDDIPDQAALEELCRQHLERQAKFARIPRPLRWLMMWHLSRKSILLRALRGASRGFLPGISTYIMKLGPGNLGQGYAGPVDRMLVASAPAVSMRIRLRNMAGLAAEGLRPLLAAHPGRPLQVLNIAGGPAMDSLNMLRLLRRDDPALLEGRPIQLHVLDPDSAGPAFGERALAAWTAPDGPLHGLRVSLERHAYDWSAPATLAALSAPWGLAESVALACSEGGLFEYGGDEVIRSNLAALARLLPADALVVGTVTRDCPIMQTMIAASGRRHPTRPRTPEAFAALAREGQWRVERMEENIISLDVRLARATE